jgi:branched-chain amino acid transport system permease protein
MRRVALLPLRRVRERGRLVVLVAAAVWPFLLDSPAAHRRGTELAALVLIGAALTVTVGWLRVLALHVPATLAGGAAATTAVLGAGQSLPLGLLTAMVVGAVLSTLTVAPALSRPRVRAPLTTLVAVVAVWGWVLPSVRLGAFARPVVVGVDLAGDRALYLAALGLAALGWRAVANLHVAPFGRRARAVGTAPELASMSGAEPRRVWLSTFALSGALGGAAGAVLAVLAQGMPQAVVFSPVNAIALLAIPLLGGREPEGAIVGALALGMAPLLLRGLPEAQLLMATALVVLIACTRFRGLVDGGLARLGRAV